MQDLATIIYSDFKREVDQSLRLTLRKATQRKRIRTLYDTYDPLARQAITESIYKDESKRGTFIRDLLFQFEDE